MGPPGGAFHNLLRCMGKRMGRKHWPVSPLWGIRFRSRQAGALIIAGLLFFCMSQTGCSRRCEAESPAAAEQRLRIGTTMHVKQTNPVADYYYNILAMLMTHDSLVRFNSEMQPVPQLASAFECEAGGKRWTFDLASGATWHDGLPVTADDVLFTFHYIADHNLPSRWIADLIETMEVTGRRVTFHLKRPNSMFLVNAGFVVRILPRHIWEKIDEPRTAQAAEITVGCGPYTFDVFDRSAGVIRFRANRGYYGDVPRTAVVEYRTYNSLDLLTLALNSNRIDAFYNYSATFPAPYLRSVRNRDGLEILESDSMGLPAVLGFNFDSPMVKRLAVRRAIALAFDYRRLNQCIMDGKGAIPGPGLVPPVFPDHVPFPSWNRDPDAGRKLLAEEGIKDEDGDGFLEDHAGHPVSLSLLARSDLWGESQIVKLLTHDLGVLGIRVAAQSVDLPTWQTLLHQGRYDLVLFRTTPWGMMMHAGYGSGYFDSRAAGGVNICRFNDPDFFRLCDRILAETHTEPRVRLYHELQTFYAEHLPAVALCWGKSFFPYSKNWEGFRVNHLEGGLANRFTWREVRFRGTSEKEPR